MFNQKQIVITTILSLFTMTDQHKDESNGILSVTKAQAHPKHHDKYRKQQIFSFISNKNLSNFICLPLSGMLWVGGFIYANQNKVSPLQTNFTRLIWQIISIFAILRIRREDVDFKNGRDFKLLLIRSTISAINGAVVGLFQMYLPLTVYYTINSSTTIFTFVLNYLLFHVPVTSRQVKAVIVALIGIALVINGRAIYQSLDSSYQFTSDFEYSSTDLWVQIFMGLLVVVWSCIWAYAIVITGKHHASFHESIFFNSVEGYFISSIFYNCLELPSEGAVSHLFIRRPDKFLKTFFYCGIPLAASNYFFILGMFISENTGVSVMLNNLSILYVYLISTIRYNEEINYICLLGAVMLIGSIYNTLFTK